ncbi:hypothetical protein HY768_03915 [candidate division TA06 bacterium]|uniref:Uncharacterized protein n=1 Tax=candidate division TA06 bacterium TaxID=2250710 RepID=A0A933MHS2_UNCT6|nr:hypothetical protein [candidate division TA06 bacterium]
MKKLIFGLLAAAVIFGGSNLVWAVNRPGPEDPLPHLRLNPGSPQPEHGRWFGPQDPRMRCLRPGERQAGDDTPDAGRLLPHGRKRHSQQAGQVLPKPIDKGLIKNDFLVNDDTTGGYPDQSEPAAAMLANGGLAVVWNDYRSGWDYNIFSRLYDPSGNPVGPDCLVNEFTGSSCSDPAIAAWAGGIVVVWRDYRNGNYDIYCQRYGSTGSPLGANFKVNDDVGTADQYYPSVSATDSGIVVAWMDYRNGTNYDIYCQRYDAGGLPIGANFIVNDDAGTANQSRPSVSATDSGIAVAWYDYRNGNADIYCQRYGSTGSPLGANFKVNDDVGTAGQYQPSVSATDSGIVVAWMDSRNGTNYDIYCQRYDAAGTLIGGKLHRQRRCRDCYSTQPQRCPVAGRPETCGNLGGLPVRPVGQYFSHNGPGLSNGRPGGRQCCGQ